MRNTYTIKYTRIYTRQINAPSKQKAKDRFLYLERQDRTQGIHKFDRLSNYEQVKIENVI